ncbi:cytokine receptor common subunit gamma [Kryptolebias marmoratus]|uniref:Cytokine receptor common subunit gamma-like n=2 Tax=Kryptolebias marmoratus TaxID=37003 RepID=A0A3Q3A5H1_KRYMA|nr:cytokine receptor common subunit gamma [Kryptolebias marmoratus]
MSARLLLFLCLFGPIMAQNPPDVTCRVMNLEYVHCSWNSQSVPEVNYTFSSWFGNKKESTCDEYVFENNTAVGCNQPCEKGDRFYTFHTVLRHGDKTYPMAHNVKDKVQLNPPTNLTVKNENDFNLWFYWNQSTTRCVEYKVRYRQNNNKWEESKVAAERQSYCINFPSSTSRYELQVRSRITDSCGKSEIWSDWSEPVVWGSNNSTHTNIINESMSVWTPVLYAVGAITLILLVLMLLHYERLRIILVPVVPKPSLKSPDVKDWFQYPKGLMKEGFKANYNEQACLVREYTYISQSATDSTDTSVLTATTYQTDCSVLIAGIESEDPPNFYSFPVSSEDEQQISV